MLGNRLFTSKAPVSKAPVSAAPVSKPLASKPLASKPLVSQPLATGVKMAAAGAQAPEVVLWYVS